MTKGMLIHLLIGAVIGGGLGALMGYFGKCSSGACPLTANPFRGAFFGMLMGLLFACSFGMQRVLPTSSETEDGAETAAALIHVDSRADFERVVLAAQLPVLADFFSNSCPPCRRLSPTIMELATDYEGRAIICKVNLDKAPELASTYAIRGIPAVLFFAEGKEKERLVGLRPKAAYAKVLDQWVSADKEENTDATL